MQPGETVTPSGQTTAPQPVPQQPAPASPPPQQPKPASPPTDPTPQPPAQDFSTPPQEFDQEPVVDIDPISWTASEFIAHSKGFSWYLLLAVIALVIAGGILLITGDKITSGMVVIVAILFGIMGARQPRELQYQVDENGVKVGEKFYDYDNFKSFSVIPEEGVETIWFMPMKRFMPGLTIYFAPEDADRIADVLSEFLPFENKTQDPIDRLMHRLRF